MPRLSKEEAKERIEKSIDQIEALVPIGKDSPEFSKWRKDTQVALENIFLEMPERVKAFTEIPYHCWSLSIDESKPVVQDASVQGLRKAEAILQSMVEEIEEYWPDIPAEMASTTIGQPTQPTVANQIFLIHGRDHGTKDTVARFLQGLGLDPIILHERPNQGRTIIEKFEEYAKTSYAIALLTPDDVGGPDADKLRPRARQNVILELGFFWGSLGRGRVAALLKDNLEIPSDYDGVVYIELDDYDGWHMKLARELKAAGFEIDLNRSL